MDDLNKLAAKHRTVMDEYFKRSEVLIARWDTENTITVDDSAHVDHANYKTIHKLPIGLGSKTRLKDECMKLPDAVERVLGIDTLHNLARPQQQQFVQEVKQLLTQTVERLKVDLENLFAKADAKLENPKRT